MLSAARLTYTAAEIEQIVSALAHGINRSSRLAGSPLQFVSGISTADDLGIGDAASATLSSAPACTVGLELTNVGATTIQVLGVGLRYTSASTANPTVYRLVDYCSVIKSDNCPSGFGAGPGSCSIYSVHVKLRAGPADSVFLGKPHAEDEARQPCPAITLTARTTVSLLVDAYSPDPMLYHAVPALDVLTASGRQVVAFPQLLSVYAFADPNAFTCYGLQGNTFVARWHGPAALEFWSLVTQKAWCL